jgi:HSP20 family protein
MPTRFDPFTEFDRLIRANWGGHDRLPSMPMDAYRRGDAFHVHFDLPGVEPEDIELVIDGDVLTVSASRSWAPVEGDRVLAHERPQGKVTRRLQLGEGVDASGIRATYDAGVLRVTIPVAEQAKPRRVAVTAAAPAAPVEATASPAPEPDAATEDGTSAG